MSPTTKFSEVRRGLEGRGGKRDDRRGQRRGESYRALQSLGGTDMYLIFIEGWA